MKNSYDLSETEDAKTKNVNGEFFYHDANEWEIKNMKNFQSLKVFQIMYCMLKRKKKESNTIGSNTLPWTI